MSSPFFCGPRLPRPRGVSGGEPPSRHPPPSAPWGRGKGEARVVCRGVKEGAGPLLDTPANHPRFAFPATPRRARGRVSGGGLPSRHPAGARQPRPAKKGRRHDLPPNKKT